MTLGPGPRALQSATARAISLSRSVARPVRSCSSAPRCSRARLPHGALAAPILMTAGLVFSSVAAAQRPIVGEGALDLVLPTGARAVALGQAAMALDGTTESVWWNPSALAGMRGTTAAIHHS